VVKMKNPSAAVHFRFGGMEKLGGFIEAFVLYFQRQKTALV